MFQKQWDSVHVQPEPLNARLISLRGIVYRGARLSMFQAGRDALPASQTCKGRVILVTADVGRFRVRSKQQPLGSLN